MSLLLIYLFICNVLANEWKNFGNDNLITDITISTRLSLTFQLEYNSEDSTDIINVLRVSNDTNGIYTTQLDIIDGTDLQLSHLSDTVNTPDTVTESNALSVNTNYTIRIVSLIGSYYISTKLYIDDMQTEAASLFTQGSTGPEFYAMIGQSIDVWFGYGNVTLVNSRYRYLSLYSDDNAWYPPPSEWIAFSRGLELIHINAYGYINVEFDFKLFSLDTSKSLFVIGNTDYDCRWPSIGLDGNSDLRFTLNPCDVSFANYEYITIMDSLSTHTIYSIGFEMDFTSDVVNATIYQYNNGMRSDLGTIEYSNPSLFTNDFGESRIWMTLDNLSPANGEFSKLQILVGNMSYLDSSAPTDAPTAEPTQPTDSPTDAPTQSPFDNPTDAPSFSPITAPTDAPTLAPFQSPTNVPTGHPSYAPTGVPTASEPTIFEPTEGTSEPPNQSGGDMRMTILCCIALSILFTVMV